MLSRFHTPCPNQAEQKLDLLIQSLYPGEYKFTGDGSFIIDRKAPDWTNINGKNKLIELFGEHVHDPVFAFRPVSENSTENGRKKVFSDLGYDTLVIWYRELKCLDIVANKIRGFHEDRCDK